MDGEYTYRGVFLVNDDQCAIATFVQFGNCRPHRVDGSASRRHVTLERTEAGGKKCGSFSLSCEMRVIKAARRIQEGFGTTLAEFPEDRTHGDEFCKLIGVERIASHITIGSEDREYWPLFVQGLDRKAFSLCQLGKKLLVRGNSLAYGLHAYDTRNDQEKPICCVLGRQDDLS